jgi:hypothetical protein
MWSSSASRSNRCDTLESVPRLPGQAWNGRYSALMRHTKHLQLLLASVLLAPVAFSQSSDSPANGSAPEEAIAAARGQYTPPTAISIDVDDGETLAQFNQRRPGPPFARQHGYPWGNYQTPWMHHGNAGHALVGAAIGFGIGAALGAHQSAQNGTPVSGGIIFGGGLLGFIGGCIGGAVGEFPGMRYSSIRRRRGYRPSWPEDDEESDLRSHSKDKGSHPEAPAKSGSPGQPAGVEAMAAFSPGKAGIDD